MLYFLSEGPDDRIPAFRAAGLPCGAKTGTDMMKNNTAKFNWPEFIKAVAVIAIPVALQNLLTTTGSMLDTMMIGTLGEKYVGAVGLCGQFSSLMGSCYFGFMGGGGLFLAQYWGARDERGLNRSFGLTLSCMLLVGVIFCVLAAAFPQAVMKLYTDKTAIQKLGIPYLQIAGFGYPFVVLSMAASLLLRSTERVKIPLVASIVSVVTNVSLNYLLIGGHLGAPALGIRGAAIATLTANIVNFAVILIIARARGYRYLFMLKAHFAWDRVHFREYFRKCFPILLNELAIGISTAIINIVLGRQSEEAIAAIAVFRTMEGLYIGFFVGFSQASSILVGKSVGAGELEEAYARAIRLVYMCAAFIAFIALLVVLLRTPIFTAFGLSGESLEIAKGMMLIFAIVIVIRMMNWLHNDTYRAAGDAATGTILEIAFMYLLVIPLLLMLAFFWHAPFLLIFAGCYVDEPIRVCLMQVHLFSGRWICPVTEEGQRALPLFRERHRIKRSQGFLFSRK